MVITSKKISYLTFILWILFVLYQYIIHLVNRGERCL